ncbi:hypothetical protein PMAYCL1PPCAC_20383, partial [Pristionchus mayeri]
MRLFWLCLVLSLATAQILPFNIFDIPASIRDPVFKTYFEATKVETQCFKDIMTAYKDLLLAGLTARSCKSLECLKDEKITNATYAMKMLASTGRPHSLDFNEFAGAFAGDSKLCNTVQGPFDTKYCFLHVQADWNSIDFEAHGLGVSSLPGGKIPQIETSEHVNGCSAMSMTNLKLALCLPASCQKDTDMNRILLDVTNGTARVCEIACEGPKEEPNDFFYFYNFILFTLLSIAIIASLLDYWAARTDNEKELKDHNGWKALMAFSIPRNTLSVFSLKKEQDAILCLDALRFISFTWVASLHSAVF